MLELLLTMMFTEDRASWFKGLKQPGTNASCCDISDCKATEAYWQGGWFAKLPNGETTPIPDNKILMDKNSIDGKAYLCAGPTTGVVYCFVRPWMGG